MKDSIIILSGGMDSVTLLHEFQERIALAVTFDYHSRHAEHEIACARWQCHKLGIPHLVINIDFMEQYFRSSLLKNGYEEIPDGQYDEPIPKSRNQDEVGRLQSHFKDMQQSLSTRFSELQHL